MEYKYKGKKVWSEQPHIADIYRIQYIHGIESYIQRKNQECQEERRRFMSPEKLCKDQELYRELYKDMLGLHFEKEEKVPETLITYVGQDEICKIYRLSVYITKEIPFYAMLLIPHGVKKCPLVIAQHGGYGTPELCSDMHGKNNYNHMVQRILERKAAVLAPQLLLWVTEELETARAHPIPYDRRKIDSNLKRYGSSITAMEICGIQKSLDAVCELPEILEDKIAMMGLSYGGYFTLYTMAADTRIKAGYTAGVFNDRDVYDWADFVYPFSALKFQDAEVAALCAPRKLYIQIGKEDKVFDYRSALPEIEKVRDYYQALECTDNLKISIWEGGHTISMDEEGYDFLFSVF